VPKAALTFLKKEDSNRNPPCPSLDAKHLKKLLSYLAKERASENLLKQRGFDSPIYTPNNNPPVFPDQHIHSF